MYIHTYRRIHICTHTNTTEICYMWDSYRNLHYEQALPTSILLSIYLCIQMILYMVDQAPKSTVGAIQDAQTSMCSSMLHTLDIWGTSCTLVFNQTRSHDTQTKTYLIKAYWLSHGSLNMKTLHVLPVLLQQGHQEVDSHLNVDVELLLRLAHISNSNSQAQHLLQLVLH